MKKKDEDLRELKEMWEKAIPPREEMDKWGREIVIKGEILNALYTFFEFAAVIIGAAANLVPAPSRKKLN